MVEAPASAPSTSSDQQPCEVRKLPALPSTGCRKSAPTTKSKRFRRSAGGLCRYFKSIGTYYAKIVFEQVMVVTTEADLPTTVEYLVILTSVKHKMQSATQGTFEERLQSAVILSAQEHGRSSEELGLRFAILQSSSFFLGAVLLRSPTVRSVQDVKKLRDCIAPFRDGVRAWGRGRGSLIWQYGLVELEERWQLLQKAVRDMWEVLGLDSTIPLERLHTWYNCNLAKRNRQLEFWELEHMALNDKKKYWPKRLRERRVSKRRTAAEMVDGRLMTVRKLLERWRRVQQMETERLEKERLKMRRQRRKERQKQRKRKVKTKATSRPAGL